MKWQLLILKRLKNLDKVNDKVEVPVDADEITEDAHTNYDNLYSEVTVHPKATVDVARDDKCTHKISTHFKTMEIESKYIDKDNKKTWRKIYEAIDRFYFREFTLFYINILEQ